MTTTANNNSDNGNKFAIIYPGEVYVCKGFGSDAPSVMPKGKRCGYATDGEYMTAVNELHGWTLDHTIFFDWAHNAYIKSRATLGELVTMTGAGFGLRADDTSDWANDLRTVIGYYIEHFDSYLDAGLDVVCDPDEVGDPTALNRALSGVIFDGIQKYVDIYDVAEDMRAFAPYGSPAKVI